MVEYLDDSGEMPPDPCTAVEVSNEPQPVPASFSLEQNFPNPFNPSTTLRFDIRKRSIATVSVYDLLGQKIETLVSEALPAGSYTAVWNGTANGSAASSGVYVVHMTAVSLDGKGETYSSIRKIVLAK